LAALTVVGESDSSISKVTLVEVEGAVISQRSAAEAVLAAVAPGIELQVVTAARRA
jgi:hypothetical protein